MSESLHESADRAGEPIGEHAWAAEHVASYVAAGLATTDRLRMFRHLQSCEECRRAVAELQTLDEEMRQLFADVHPSPDLETRTVQAVRREPKTRARARRAAWSGPMKAMLVAAAVMLFFGVGAFLSEAPSLRESVAQSSRDERISEHGLATLFDSTRSNSVHVRVGRTDAAPGAVEFDSDVSYELERGSDPQVPDAASPNDGVSITNGEAAARSYSYLPNLGLIVPSDGRSHSYLTGGFAGGKGEKSADSNKAILHGEPNDQAKRFSLGTGSMATWGRTGAVKEDPIAGKSQPLQASREPNGRTESARTKMSGAPVPELGGIVIRSRDSGDKKGLEDLTAATNGKPQGGSIPQSGFGGSGGGGGFGGGGRGGEKKWDDNNAPKEGINFGMGLSYDNAPINNTVTGGRSVTSSTTTNGSVSSNWSVPVGGPAIPGFSDTTGAPTSSSGTSGESNVKRSAGRSAGVTFAPAFAMPPKAPEPDANKAGDDKAKAGKSENRPTEFKGDGEQKRNEDKKVAETAEKVQPDKKVTAGDTDESAKSEAPRELARPATPGTPTAAQLPPAGEPPATQPPLATQHRKIIIRSGDIEFEVDSFDAAVASIVQIIGRTKEAFIATVNSEKLANGKMRGSVVVRMPPERLDEFVLELRKTLSKAGDLKGQRIGSQDVTKHYTDLESELKAHRTMESRLLDILKNGKGAVKDLLAVEKDLGVYREKIEKIEGELRYYANLAALSTLTITLQEKEIRAAAAYTETERVNAGIEVEEVEKAYQEAQAAVREMKGRISQAEMKQQAAGQFNAKLVFEIAPEQAGPMRDRLRQLGNMVRLEMDRVQKIENGGEPTKDGKIRRGDTEFIVSIYNLANVEPRETTMLTLVAADVPAAYQKLRASLAKLKTTMRNAALQEHDKTHVEAGIDFDVRRIDEPAAQAALDAVGEVVFRRALRQAEGNNLTDAKVRFTVRILSTSTIEPRETIHRLIAVPDVAAAYRRVQETVTAKEMQGQVKTAALQQTDRNNVTGTLDFVVRRSDEDAVRKLVDELGETLTRQSEQKLGDGITDAKVRYDIRFIPETSVEARDQVEAKLAAIDVPATYRKLRTLIEGLKGQIRGASIQENDRVNIQASLTFVVNRADETAVQTALADLGEVLNRSSKRRPESERVTNSKIEFALNLVSAAAEIKARKKFQIEEIVDKVDVRLAEFNDAVLKVGGRIVGVPRDEALKSGGARGSVIYDVPLAAVDGIVARIRAATLDNRFVQIVTEDASAPEGKLAIARVELTIATPDFLVSRDNDFDAQLRYGLSVALSWLIRSASWLISGLVFFLPWVIVIGAIVFVVRLFRRTPAAQPAATPPTVGCRPSPTRSKGEGRLHDRLRSVTRNEPFALACASGSGVESHSRIFDGPFFW